TAAFEAEHKRRSSSVRFVQGDLHDPATVRDVGVHDVVWCSGVLYHAPHPLLTLQHLRELTGRRLILSTATIPEVPGIKQACVLYPGLDAGGRAIFAPVLPGPTRLAISEPFDPAESYGNWWWGITPSALRGMLTATGFELEELIVTPFAATAVARVAEAGGE
ncbi:MAG TPA: hypothetical protein VHE14_04840, partial [Solirubrobacteraceae bacterium]|nr:hypothetical protein [Solirubrobacteraceae bacterium]